MFHRANTARTSLWVQVLLVVWLAISSTMLALTYRSMPVQAGDVTSRKITMVSSEENLETNYDIDFTIPAGTTVGAILIEFCDNNPIPSTSCVFNAVGDDIPQVDSNAGSIVTEDATDVGTLSGAVTCTNISVTAPGAGDQFVLMPCNTAETFAGSTNFHIQLNDVDNPDNSTDSPTNPNNGFYARLYVYSVTNPTVPTTGSGNTASSTNLVHTGGVALSTAEQLTITARVQEVLDFCVGDDATAVVDATDGCAEITGNDIDMGVIDFAAPTVASTDAGENGYAMVRTNAVSGVVIDYFANNGNADDSESDGYDDGHLAVSGAACDFAATETDQCINSIGTTETALAVGTEAFGMTATSVDTTAGGGATTNLVRDTQYDNDTGYAFDGSGATDRLASSAGSAQKVVNDEMLVLDWSAIAEITTPTGVYSTVLTFIATPTF